MFCGEYGIKQQIKLKTHKAKDKLQNITGNFMVGTDIKVAEYVELEMATTKWFIQQQTARMNNVHGMEIAAAVEKLARHMNIDSDLTDGLVSQNLIFLCSLVFTQNQFSLSIVIPNAISMILSQ